jgi:eukaryotic-like serine/threonine-protein kinase
MGGVVECDANPPGRQAPPSLALGSVPSRLGRYEIQSLIGCGMMGIVYKAWDPLLGRPVAIKMLRLDFPMREDERQQMEQRFLREASLAAALSHPAIVVVHDIGRDPESARAYIALEYLEGRTLAEIAAPACLDWRTALRLTARLAEALHHAHGHGIVHRDIKPSNVMVLPSGDPKILDFGIARASAGQLTGSGEAWGTPSYMSPEQATASVVDGRSDLFSLGSVLYELLTGRRAFPGDGVAQVMARVVREDPPQPTGIVPVLPTGVDFVVARALAKDPAERYPDGRTFAEDLEDILAYRLVRPRTGLRGLPPARRSWGPLPAATLHAADAASRTLTTRVPTRRGRRTRKVSRRIGSWIPGAVLGASLAIAAVMLAPAASAPVAARSEVASAALPVDELPSLSAAPEPAPRQEAAPVLASSRPAARPAAPALLAPVEAHAAPAPLPVAPEPEAAVAQPEPEPAHVALSVEHGFRRGQLRVWVDDTLVLERALAAPQTRSLLFLKKRKGSFAEVVDVPPGVRRLRLEVSADGSRRSGELRGTFKSDETRLLEVKLGDRVDLDWKS